jgi:hypothetical protein
VKLVDTVNLKFTLFLVGIGSSPIVNKNIFIYFLDFMKKEATKYGISSVKLTVDQLISVGVHLGTNKT